MRSECASRPLNACAIGARHSFLFLCLGHLRLRLGFSALLLCQKELQPCLRNLHIVVLVVVRDFFELLGSGPLDLPLLHGLGRLIVLQRLTVRSVLVLPRLEWLSVTQSDEELALNPRCIRPRTISTRASLSSAPPDARLFASSSSRPSSASSSFPSSAPSNARLFASSPSRPSSAPSSFPSSSVRPRLCSTSAAVMRARISFDQMSRSPDLASASSDPASSS